MKEEICTLIHKVMFKKDIHPQDTWRPALTNKFSPVVTLYSIYELHGCWLVIPKKDETDIGLLWGASLDAYRVQYLGVKIFQIMWKVEILTTIILKITQNEAI